MSQHPSREARETDSAEKKSVRSGRLWLWFVIGFLLVFIMMALFVTMYSLHPSGNAAVACRLWEYYFIEFRRVVGPYNNILGPATGSSSTAIETAFFHVLFSVIGGAVLAGVGWCVRKIKR